MLIQQFFEPISSTYTYLLFCSASRHAALIDPVISQTDVYIEAIKTQQLELKYILETHLHADHITGASELRSITGAQLCIHQNSHVTCADVLVQDNGILHLGQHQIHILHTPGHTNACVCFYIHGAVFTGDALLINGCGRTDFQQGSAANLYDSVHNKLFTLPEETVVYPAHDYHGLKASTIGLEKKNNIRLGQDKTKAEFITIMQQLNLPYPKLIDQALPANQQCGRIEV